MVKKNYLWETGAEIDEHSKQKHKILQEYFREYLITRCRLPQQEKFRLAVIDGFSGAGKYKCGTYGSPLLFLNVLKETLQEINISRSNNNMRLIQIECYLIFNDSENYAVQELKKNAAPLIAEINDNHDKLHIRVEYLNKKFDEVYPEIKQKLVIARYRNVLFNLDQCGYSDINTTTIKNIMLSWRSAEIFLTFAISSFKTFFSTDINKNRAKLNHTQQVIDFISSDDIQSINKKELLGGAEQIIFNFFESCAQFTSPFSINNPGGWRYWLIHFANSFRARQVYNNILHENATSQAHFGKFGLDMLAYDPSDEGGLYLFDNDSRRDAKKELYDDIPRFIDDHGDSIKMNEFYNEIYNGTAAHSDDIHDMIMENPDIEVITPDGGKRRKANSIKSDDILNLKEQRSFFPMFVK